MDKIKALRDALAAKQAALAAFDNQTEFSAEENSSIETLSNEVEALVAQITSLERIASAKAAVEAPVARKAAPALNDRADSVIVRPTQKELNGGFDNMGQLLKAVRGFVLGDAKDQRLNNIAFEKYGEDGGFLVPEQFLPGIQKKFDSDESLLARTTQIKVSGNSLTIPTDETAPWNGGVVAYWMGEGQSYTESKGKLGLADLKLAKLGAMVKVTEELLEDGVALESYMMAKAPEAMMWKMNSAIISGDGVQKPNGILNSGFTVTVAAEAGQTADTVVAANIVKMYSRMLPQSRNKAVWFINPAVEAQLYLMTDPNGNYIYLAPGSQMNQSPYGLLMGRPVIPMLGAMPALGDVGDIIFADLSYYYSITKASGIKQSISTHLYFDKDVTAYKWSFRVDGKCPFKAPVTPEFGTYPMSAFVNLAAR